MGAGSSSATLRDSVDEASARQFCGSCFDLAEWETISEGTGSVCKKSFMTAILIRDNAPSLRAWLELWRIDELTEMLTDLDVLSPTDVADLEGNALGQLSLKAVQKHHWEKALAHARYLKDIQVDKPPSPLNLWLESWRLERFLPQLSELGCDVKEDIMDLDDVHVSTLEMRLLEARRWKQATAQLLHLVRSFSFSDESRCSVPSLNTWLQSLKLEKLRPKLIDLGVVELCDLADIDDRELASLGMTKLQLKHWDMGMLQVMAANREAELDGKNDDPTFRCWLESWRLTRLQETMESLGAFVQQDLLDLQPSEYGLLKMKSLESKRFEQAMVALEAEFSAQKPLLATNFSM